MHPYTLIQIGLCVQYRQAVRVNYRICQCQHIVAQDAAALYIAGIAVGVLIGYGECVIVDCGYDIMDKKVVCNIGELQLQDATLGRDDGGRVGVSAITIFAFGHCVVEILKVCPDLDTAIRILISLLACFIAGNDPQYHADQQRADNEMQRFFQYE